MFNLWCIFKFNLSFIMAAVVKNMHKRTLIRNYYRYNLYLNANYFSNHQELSMVLKHDTEQLKVSADGIQVSKYLQPFINSSVEDILSKVHHQYILPSESVTLLKALRMHMSFKGTNPDSFKADERFKILCKIYEANCTKLYPTLLVSGLRSLLEVGVDPETNCVKRGEENVLKKLNLFNMTNLIGCLHFYQKYANTDLQKYIISMLVKEILDRMSEITTSTEVLMLLPVMNFFDDEKKGALDKKIVELIGLLNIHELCKVVCLLAEKFNRNKPILNAVSFQLQQKFEKPDIKEIIDILYALKSLNFCDVKLILYLLDGQIYEISSIKDPSLISRLLTICGHLKWKHHGVLEACSDWIMNHISVCRAREFVSYILTLAALNYIPPKSENIFKTILPLLSLQKVMSSDIWLNVVWSLAILNNVEKNILLEVLKVNFYQPLIDGSNFEAVSNKLKLMNLKAAMNVSYPECVFGCDLYLDPIEITQSSEKEKSRKLVIQALSNFIPKGKLCLNQSTDMGIFIDAEFIMDKNMKPLPLSDYGTSTKLVDFVKPLPKDAKRFAILVLFYKDYTLNEVSLCGVSALATRLLIEKNYIVVKVPYDEFAKNNTEVKKSKYLLRMIYEAQLSSSKSDET